MSYLLATEPTKEIDYSQAFNCFNVMHGSMNKQRQPFGLHFFSKVVFNILICINRFIWQFFIVTKVIMLKSIYKQFLSQYTYMTSLKLLNAIMPIR